MKAICLKCKKPLKEPIHYGLHQHCFLEWFKVSKAYGFRDLDVKRIASSSQGFEIKRKKDTFYHGRYLKYSAHLNGVDYILKVQEKKYRDLPGMEYTCNRIASLLSLDVPKYYLILFRQQLTFVTYNFMQDDNKSRLDHIYKFLPEGEEHYNCVQLIRVIKEQTGRLTDIAQFVSICLFDALIGNNDRHGRNLGIIVTQNKKKLAPMYDNPSYFGVENNNMLGADLNPSGSIWTKSSKEPKFLDYVKEFQRLGYQDICFKFKEKFLKQFPFIKQEVHKAFISKQRQKAFLTFLKKKVKDCEAL